MRFRNNNPQGSDMRKRQSTQHMSRGKRKGKERGKGLTGAQK